MSDGSKLCSISSLRTVVENLRHREFKGIVKGPVYLSSIPPRKYNSDEYIRHYIEMNQILNVATSTNLKVYF